MAATHVAAGSKLPKGLTCFERVVYDGRSGDLTAGMGRMGYLACGALRNDQLKQVMPRNDAALLARVGKIPEEEIDHRWVFEAVSKSQSSWEKFSHVQCERWHDDRWREGPVGSSN